VRELVVDPLIDASTGQQTVATVRMGNLLERHVVERRRSFTLRAFDRDTLSRRPRRSSRASSPRGSRDGSSA
jgi:hypothetical protein